MTLRLASYLAVAGTYALIVMGAIVRASGSGLGCPDWPLCHGQVVPPSHVPAIIEYSHRLLGGIDGLFILTTLALWTRAHRFSRRSVLASVGLLVLLGAQVGLGAAVVNLELPPMLVMIHLGMAMILFAFLITIAVEVNGLSPAGPTESPIARASSKLVRLTAGAVGAVYVLLLVGAFVRASGASWACTGFPTCNGALLPFGASPAVDTHLLHRLLAYVVAAHLLVTITRAWRSEGRVAGVRGASALVLISLFAQISIGAAAVSTGVPPLAQVLHVAGAAALWGSTVTLFTLTLRSRSLLGPSTIALAGHGASQGTTVGRAVRVSTAASDRVGQA